MKLRWRVAPMRYGLSAVPAAGVRWAKCGTRTEGETINHVATTTSGGWQLATSVAGTGVALPGPPAAALPVA